MMSLIERHKNEIVQMWEWKLLPFVQKAINSNNKKLLQALGESKIFESTVIPYTRRVELLNNLTNSYSSAYNRPLELSSSQLDTYNKMKSIDINTLSEQFKAYTSPLQVLQKSELVNLLKPYYFPKDYPSDIIEETNINRATLDEPALKAAINAVAEQWKEKKKIYLII